jgi:hypothetical protein
VGVVHLCERRGRPCTDQGASQTWEINNLPHASGGRRPLRSTAVTGPVLHALRQCWRCWRCDCCPRAWHACVPVVYGQASVRALAFTPPAPRSEGSKAAAVARNRAGRLFCLVRRGHSGRALSRPAHVRPSLQLHSLSPVCGRPIACSSAFYIGIARAAPAAAPYCSRRNGSQTACCSPTKAGPVAVHARDAWGRARQRFMLIGHRLVDFSSIPDTLRFRATRIPRRRKRTLAHIPSTPGSTRTKANLDRERAIYHALVVSSVGRAVDHPRMRSFLTRLARTSTVRDLVNTYVDTLRAANHTTSSCAVRTHTCG